MNKITRSSISFVAIVTVSATVIARYTLAAENKEGRVTEIHHDVRILASQAASRPAAVNDNVRAGTAVRTGDESRAEITFNDQSLARLGANTVFSFSGGAKTYDLGSGAILMTAPEGAGELKIRGRNRRGQRIHRDVRASSQRLEQADHPSRQRQGELSQS